MSAIKRLSTQATVILLVLVFSLAGAAGCQRASLQQGGDEAPDVAMTLTIAPDPAAVGPAQLTVTLADQAGQAIDGATVRLKGDMSHAGMQPVLADASSAGDGVYTAALTWTMAGDWFVTVTAGLPDGRTAVRRFDLTVQR
jgi:hypothetical protein